MEILSCKGCGRLFNYIRGERLCDGCKKKLEDKFVVVKKYVRENPTADIKDIAKDNEVSISQLNRWIREERLTFSEDSPIGLPCERCGTTIKTGRFCDACKNSLQNDFKEAAGLNRSAAPQSSMRKSASSRMRFLDQ